MWIEYYYYGDVSIRETGEEMTTTRHREWLPVREWKKRHPYFGAVNFIYEKSRDGTLLSIKVGGRVLIASDALDILAEET